MYSEESKCEKLWAGLKYFPRLVKFLCVIWSFGQAKWADDISATICHAISYPLSVSRAAKWWQARLRKMGSKWLHEFIGWSVLVPYNLSPNPIYGLSAPKTDPFFVFIETRTWSLIQWEINIMRGQSHSLPQFHWYIF